MNKNKFQIICVKEMPERRRYLSDFSLSCGDIFDVYDVKIRESDSKTFFLVRLDKTWR